MRKVVENPTPLKKHLFYDDKSKLWYLASDQFKDIKQKIYRKSKSYKDVLNYARKFKRFKEDVTVHKKAEKYDKHRIFSGFEKFQKIKKDFNLLMRQFEKVRNQRPPEPSAYKKLLARFSKVADKARSLNVGQEELKSIADFINSVEGKEAYRITGQCTLISAESGKLYNTRVFFDKMFLYKVFQQAQWLAKAYNFIEITFEFLTVNELTGEETVLDYFSAKYAANFFEPVILPRQGKKIKKKARKMPEEMQYYSAVGDFLNSVSEDLTDTLQDLSEEMRMDFTVLATLEGVSG